MAFPSTLQAFNRPNATDRLNNPSHSALHNTVSSALGQVEAVIGVDGASSVVGTMMYDLRSPASGGGGHVQVANKGGTGQTSYTKGDILVAQSSSVLTKLAVGSDTYLLQADSSQATGIKWSVSNSSTLGISNPTSLITQATSSVWSKPTGLSYILVEVVGGGGGGGSSNTTANAQGGGGGGGAYSRKIILASVLGSTENLIVGALGAGGSGGAGGKGGTTGFGTTSILYATGGTGGSRGAAGAGGSGGTASGGNINVSGQSGEIGGPTASGVYRGQGGNSPIYGNGGKTTTNAGGAGIGYGAGGSGGFRTDGEYDGGPGIGGVCIITEYYA